MTTAEEKLEALSKLHHEKYGYDSHDEPYVICAYDKTRWPCLTQTILFPEPELDVLGSDAEVATEDIVPPALAGSTEERGVSAALSAYEWGITVDGRWLPFGSYSEAESAYFAWQADLPEATVKWARRALGPVEEFSTKP